jgi:anti-sigma factor RsiW
MNERDFEQRLNDYVDGLLPEEEARAFEKALKANPELRKAEAELRNLLAAADGFPKGVVPEHDLWPAIQARLRPKRSAARLKRVTPVWRLRWAIAVAAAALMILAVGLVERYMTPGSPLTPGAGKQRNGSAAAQAIAAELRPVEAEYHRARASLRDKLEASKESLAPETVNVVEENLAVIDEAIAEIQTALKEDPGNERLAHRLVATYDKEVELLEQAVRVSEGV